jgi:hypothetical protein
MMEGGWETFKPTENDHRVMLMKGCEEPIWRDCIPEYLNIESKIEVQFFWQYKSLGWPYTGGWAEQPAQLVDVVFLLESENGKRIKALQNG